MSSAAGNSVTHPIVFLSHCVKLSELGRAGQRTLDQPEAVDKMFGNKV